MDADASSPEWGPPPNADLAAAPLGAEARGSLLALARDAVRAVARSTDGRLSGGPLPAALDRRAGAFVTLYVEDRLRGCLGTFEPARPLWQTVREMAAAAATRDPRFPPISPDELAVLRLTVSVLSPLRAIASHQEIEVGRHGLEVSRGARRGVLLPQVAVEHGLSRDEFLAETCLKAGLAAQAWRDPATVVRVFEAEVFGD